jgi:hypothetical protein
LPRRTTSKLSSCRICCGRSNVALPKLQKISTADGPLATHLRYLVLKGHLKDAELELSQQYADGHRILSMELQTTISLITIPEAHGFPDAILIRTLLR